MTLSMRTAFGATLAAALAASVAALPADAGAQPTPPVTRGQRGEPGEPPAPTRPAPEPEVQSQITGQPNVATTGLLGPIERLPATGYPTYPIRGIYGGSLWRIFHGLQWPYYPKTGIAVSGYGWIDTAYEHVGTDQQSVTGERTMVQRGRVLVRVTPTWSNGNYFVQGQAELVANRDQSQQSQTAAPATADDVWLRVGQWNTWDVTVGRFEGWEVYHRGLGLEDVNSIEFYGATLQSAAAPNIYGVTEMFFRQNGIGQAAVHYYPSSNLRFEVQGQYGSEGSNTVGVRPVGILDVGFFKAKFGAEYVADTPIGDDGKGHTERRGLGGSLQFVFDPYVDFGASAAARLRDVYNPTTGAYDLDASDTVYSVGGFLNARLGIPELIFGGGYDYTYREDEHVVAALGRGGRFRHQQMFGAIQYYLWRQLFIKGVVSYALGEFAPIDHAQFKVEAATARLRLEYLF